MLRDPLDEPEFYCVDVAGFGSNLNLNSPLQAHTCKPGADDEVFIFNHPAPGPVLYGCLRLFAWRRKKACSTCERARNHQTNDSS